MTVEEAKRLYQRLNDDVMKRLLRAKKGNG